MVKRNWIKRAAVLVLTCLVAVGAWKMPEMVYSFSDSRNLGQRQHFQLDLKQYAKEGSAEEQLYSFALCSGEDSDYTMKAVKMKGDTQADSDEELIRIIQSELQRLGDVLKEDKLLTQEISPEDMTGRELYTAYIASADEADSRESITFWKVKLQRSDSEESRYELEVILDMEYHKIYSLKLSNKAVTEQCDRYMQQKEKRYRDIVSEEECWSFVDSVRSYYGEVPAKYTMGLGVEGSFVYDAVKDNTVQQGSVSEEGMAEGMDETLSVTTLHRLQGAFVYYDSERGTEYNLNFINQYEITEAGDCYLKIEIENLEEILQN